MVLVEVVDDVACVADAIVVGIGDAFGCFVVVIPIVPSDDGASDNIGSACGCLIPAITVDAFVDGVFSVMVEVVVVDGGVDHKEIEVDAILCVVADGVSADDAGG